MKHVLLTHISYRLSKIQGLELNPRVSGKEVKGEYESAGWESPATQAVGIWDTQGFGGQASKKGTAG